MLKYLSNELRRYINQLMVYDVISRNNYSTISSHLAEKMRSTLPKKHKLPNIKYILTVASGKGGVGKSTVAVNLAVALATHKRLRVGLLDADLYGPSIPIMMNLTTKNKQETMVSLSEDHGYFIPPINYGVSCMSIGFFMQQEKDAIIWRGLMITKALEQLLFQTRWGDLDILVIDMPPGTGDTQLTVTQLIHLSGAVIVSTPQDVALIDAQKAVQMFQKVQVPILGIVENMSNFICPHCQHSTPIFKTNDASWLTNNNFNIPLLAKVPLDPQICVASDDGHPAVISLPLESPIRREFEHLAHQTIERLTALDIKPT
jgi:ATP-binding protein involved in chromosome partitioning